MEDHGVSEDAYLSRLVYPASSNDQYPHYSNYYHSEKGDEESVISVANPLYEKVLQKKVDGMNALLDRIDQSAAARSGVESVSLSVNETPSQVHAYIVKQPELRETCSQNERNDDVPVKSENQPDTTKATLKRGKIDIINELYSKTNALLEKL